MTMPSDRYIEISVRISFIGAEMTIKCGPDANCLRVEREAVRQERMVSASADYPFMDMHNFLLAHGFRVEQRQRIEPIVEMVYTRQVT